MKTETTRRAALGGAAAIAVLPIAAMGPAAAGKDDAELLRLGAELDAFYPQWLRDREREYAAHDAAEEELERRLGFQPGPHMTRPQAKEWHQTMIAVWDETGTNAVVKSCEASWNRLDRIQQRLLKLEAHTPAGVAVKARALARFSMWKAWEKAEPDDWNDHLVRHLIEAVCKLAGTSPGVVNA
jgi:hypothetical protein